MPRIFIGGNCIGGASDLLTLKNSGELKTMMEKAGAQFKAKSA